MVYIIQSYRMYQKYNAQRSNVTCLKDLAAATYLKLWAVVSCFVSLLRP